MLNGGKHTPPVAQHGGKITVPLPHVPPAHGGGGGGGGEGGGVSGLTYLFFIFPSALSILSMTFAALPHV